MPHSEPLRVSVRLTPRSAREEVVLRDDGSLAVRVTAPALEGRANTALERAVAKAAGVAPSRVMLVRGARSRDKLLQIDGLDAAGLRQRLTGG